MSSIRERIISMEADDYAGILSNEYIIDNDNQKDITYDDIENAYKAGAKSERNYILSDVINYVKTHEKPPFISQSDDFNQGFVYGLNYVRKYLEILLGE